MRRVFVRTAGSAVAEAAHPAAGGVTCAPDGVAGPLSCDRQ